LVGAPVDRKAGRGDVCGSRPLGGGTGQAPLVSNKRKAVYKRATPNREFGIKELIILL